MDTSDENESNMSQDNIVHMPLITGNAVTSLEQAREVEAGSSKDKHYSNIPVQQPKTIEEEATKFIKEAQRSKARLYKVPGNFDINQTNLVNLTRLVDSVEQPGWPGTSIVQMDEDYQMIDTHIDESFKKRIQEFEYIDFSKLVTKSKVLKEEDWKL